MQSEVIIPVIPARLLGKLTLQSFFYLKGI